MNSAKAALEVIFFGFGAIAGYLFGPCDNLLRALLVFIVLDIALGVVSACTGKSKHTVNGRLSSEAMRSGLAKKAAELAIVIVGNTLDMVTGMTVVRSGVCVALICSEAISVVETASLLGVVNIPIINKALEVLQEKETEGK